MLVCWDSDFEGNWVRFLVLLVQWVSAEGGTGSGEKVGCW